MATFLSNSARLRHDDPSPEEMAAITAAIEVVWPRPPADVDQPDESPAWRFSGRWWNKPIAARRERPWS